MLESDTPEKAQAILEIYRKHKLKIATAESCTGGLIAAAFTHVPGSSDVFERGFVTYSNEAKIEMLNVPRSLIQQHGAVSADVAGAMAQGTLTFSHADIAVSVTGVAGPSGGSADKPVGLVWFGRARRGGVCTTHAKNFAGDRAAVRSQSVDFALSLFESALAET